MNNFFYKLKYLRMEERKKKKDRRNKRKEKKKVGIINGKEKKEITKTKENVKTTGKNE